MPWVKKAIVLGLVATLLSPSLSWALYFHLKDGRVIQGEIKDGDKEKFKVILQGQEIIIPTDEVKGVSLDGQLNLWDKPVARLALYNSLRREAAWYRSRTYAGALVVIGVGLFMFSFFLSLDLDKPNLWVWGSLLGLPTSLIGEGIARERAENFNIGLKYMLKLPE